MRALHPTLRFFQARKGTLRVYGSGSQQVCVSKGARTQVSKTHSLQLRKIPSQGPAPAHPQVLLSNTSGYFYLALIIPHGERDLTIEKVVGRHCFPFSKCQLSHRNSSRARAGGGEDGGDQQQEYSKNKALGILLVGLQGASMIACRAVCCDTPEW